MPMRRRSGVLTHDEQLLKLSLGDMDKEIARCEMRRKIAPSALLRKAFERRLRQLRRIREKIAEAEEAKIDRKSGPYRK
jgi:hypothetical protein